MVQKLKAEGFDQFQTVVNEVENKNPNGEVFILFSGSKDTTGNLMLLYSSKLENFILVFLVFVGQSWCPDCVEGKLNTVVSCKFSLQLLLLLKLSP